jgi:hypothetical protein
VTYHGDRPRRGTSSGEGTRQALTEGPSSSSGVPVTANAAALMRNRQGPEFDGRAEVGRERLKCAMSFGSPVLT